MSRNNAVLSFAAVLFFFSGSAMADGDQVLGKTVFGRCIACHAVAENKIGPLLGGVVGRKAGTVPGFKYSKGMTNADIVWNEKNLDAYLAAPAKLVPNTSMPINVPAAQDRSDLIAYLKTLNAK